MTILGKNISFVKTKGLWKIKKWLKLVTGGRVVKSGWNHRGEKRSNSIRKKSPKPNSVKIADLAGILHHDLAALRQLEDESAVVLNAEDLRPVLRIFFNVKAE